MISAIIFSKDRASQLDLLLDSIDKNGSNLFDIHVIYTSSSELFQEGYNLLQSQRDYVNWIKQESPPSDFREIVLSTIERSEEYLCFFVDDNILYRKIETTLESIDGMFKYFESENQQLLCLSLRLGSNTSVQNEYENKMCPFPQEVIEVDNLYAVWDWTLLPRHTNFAYPFSVDGHIYKKDQTLKMITYDFDTPNGLEGSGKFSVLLPNLMACFDDSPLVNCPINIVGSSENKAGEKHGMGLEELNSLFLSGQSIDLESMDFSDVRGCHQEFQYQFKGEVRC